MHALNWAPARLWFLALVGVGAIDMDKHREPVSESGPRSIRRPRTPSVDDYVSGVLSGDRSMLARAITLIESHSRLHEAQAQEVLQRLFPHTGNSRRIGITGVPGVGKSTFIESFGCFLVSQGRKLAVLTIDPSSSRSGGSILGDKTRMERLSREPNAFIRPSPAGGSLGGVARRTRETMLLCEAAGFETILVETVGVGQSEVALRSMVDFFLLLLLPGAGDELQGIKKGIIEMADLVLINKADGPNRLSAELARSAQEAALHYSESSTPEWKIQVALCSGLTGDGVPRVWDKIDEFFQTLAPKGVIQRNRDQQNLDWMTDLVHEELRRRFYQDPRITDLLTRLRGALLRGEITAVRAAQDLLIAHSQPEGASQQQHK